MQVIEAIVNFFAAAKLPKTPVVTSAQPPLSPPNSGIEYYISQVPYAEFDYQRQLSDLSAARDAAMRYGSQPTRWELMRVFENILQNDAHLVAVIEKRVLKTTNKTWRVVNARTGKESTEATKLLQKQWVSDYISELVKAKFYGYSLPQLLNVKGEAYNFECRAFDRKYVLPEYNAITRDYHVWATKGGQVDNITTFDLSKPPFSYFLILHDTRTLGLLNVVAPLALLKRHSWSAWAAYEKIFGVPIRVAKSNTKDAKQTAQIREWLDKMGSASYGIFPDGTELDIIAPSGSDAFNLFMRKIETINTEISQLIEGATLTSGTAANGNRALGEVHAAEADAISADDRKDVETHFNSFLLKFLREIHGFPLSPNDVFRFDTEREHTLDERLKVVDTLSRAGFVLDGTYIAETFGVKLQTPDKQAEQTPQNSQTKKNPNSNGFINAVSFYEHAQSCPTCAGEVRNEGEDFVPPENVIYVEAIIQEIHAGTFTTQSAAYRSLLRSYYDVLKDAVSESYPPTEFVRSRELLEIDCLTFSGAKTAHESRAFYALLFDDDGNVRSFAEFQKLALERHALYNNAWLKTEYELARQGSRMARVWDDLAERDDEPNLTYRTVQDKRVRDSHAALNKVTRPMSDAWWDKYYPPNGWRCRCGVQTASLSTKITNPAPEPKLEDSRFYFNVGKTKQIFPPEHPYYDTNTD